MKINLNGLWKLQSNAYPELDAQIPGSVLSTLLKHGKIVDPNYACNEKEVYPCLRQDYTFKRCFSMTKQQLSMTNYLFLDGVHTIADVYINGVLLEKLYDMHLPKRILLDNDMLREENEISICFHNAYDYIENYPDKEKWASFAVTHPNGPVIRQSHHMLGWDWGPDLSDMGIFRDVYILSTNLGYLESFRHTCVFLPDGSVRVDVDTHVEAVSDGTLTSTLSLEQDGTLLTESKPLSKEEPFSFLLLHPKRWNPIGFGEPTLYTLNFVLTGADGEVQEYSYRIGIRQVEIDNSHDAYGTDFCVRINGEKVFIKGSNYIPQDMIFKRVTKESTERLLCLAKDFNHNTVRVWGGGYYPDPDFYDFCDENGILVWQDLMFACSSYNIHDRNFRDLIVEETVSAVKYFRHHASVFYIAGDNECEDGVNGHEPELMEQYRIMSQEILVPLMKTLTDTFYAYTSPHNDTIFHMQNDLDHFDTHYWTVRNEWLPLEEFKNASPRMASETGHESFPMPDTIAKYYPEEAPEIESPANIAHEKRPTGNRTVAWFVEQRYGKAESFGDFLYLQNLLQGEAIDLFARHLRTTKYRCNGLLYWQLNDCWPGLSCSSVDYDYGLKALHYFSRHFYAPHMIVADECDGKLVVRVANDTPHPAQYRVLYRYMNFTGDILDEKQLQTQVDKTADREVLCIDTPFAEDGLDKLVYVCLTDEDGHILSEHIYQHALQREVAYLPAHFMVKKIDEHTIEVTSDVFTRGVYLNCGSSAQVFSDNYFDLLPGQKKTVTSEEVIDCDSLTLQCLNHTHYSKEG